MKKKKIRLNIVSRSKVAVAFYYLQLAVMSPILIPAMLVQIISSAIIECWGNYKTGISPKPYADAMNWKKLTEADYSDDEIKVLRITTKHGRVVYETGVADKGGELWHHSDSSAFPSRYLGTVKQHKEIHFVAVNEILF